MKTVTVHDGRPAVNVKVQNFGGPDLLAAIRERFGCDLETAEQASEMAWESATSNFWRDWSGPDIEDRFGQGYRLVTFEAGGRSGGWLEVYGLPDDIDYDWSPELVAQWASFEADVLADVAHYTAAETILDDIEANRWAEPGAELFNYLDRNGETVCVVDEKRIRDAAPDLLAALERLASSYQTCLNNKTPAKLWTEVAEINLRFIRAAVAKATGATA